MPNTTLAPRRCGTAHESDESAPAGFPDSGALHNAAGSDADRRLVETVNRALRATDHPALRNLDIEIYRGVVVLWGRVTTYHQKQLAQATAQKVEGVQGIANGLEVICCRGSAGDTI